MAQVIYVKTGLAGYGPDLDPEDTGHDPAELDSVLESIRYELDQSCDMLADEASSAGAVSDFEAYFDARELADKLESVRANFDPERRKAPLFNGPDAVDFDHHIWEQVLSTFPLVISTNGYTQLYVWMAEGELESEDD